MLKTKVFELDPGSYQNPKIDEWLATHSQPGVIKHISTFSGNSLLVVYDNAIESAAAAAGNTDVTLQRRVRTG